MLVEIHGYEGRYSVSDEGRVWSHITSRYLAPGIDEDGYFAVTLHEASGKKKTFQVSRLVAAAFIGPPPFDRAQVNHIDGVKKNNAARNLEWVTQAENYRHSIEVLGYPPPRNPGKPVKRISPSGEVKQYKCGMDAVRDGFLSSGISQACTGVIRSHRGYVWQFA